MQKTRQVFLSFLASETDKTFRLDRRIRGVRHVYLRATSFEGTTSPAVLIDIDGMAPDICTEGLGGYPIPLLGKGGATGVNDGGMYFDFPLLLFSPNTPSLTTMRVRLSNVDGTPFVHAGLNLWLEFRCDPEVYDGQSVRAEQWLKSGTALSGIGQNDYRWDYVPSATELAENLATLERRFSILSGEKQK